MFEHKKILILGFARSGYEAAKVLIHRGNEVILNDGKNEENLDSDKLKELKDLGVQFVLGGHPDNLLDESFDYLIKNPGVAIDHKYVLLARKLNIPVINEVEMAYLLMPKDKNIKLIAITGTNGKTTTTTLIYNFLKTEKEKVHLAGNIGYPLCSFLDKLSENDIIVMETSCQQLENVNSFHPNISVLTNISEAHLEFMKTYDYYKEVKRRIFKNQTKEDVAIVNLGNEEATLLSDGVSSRVKYFSSKGEINGAYIKDGFLYYYDEKIIATKDIFLKGVHNYENIMAAIMVAKEFEISNQSICTVLKEFSGVEHRLEFVDNINGIKFYNDTEATNIKCSQIALSSFQEPIVLILGGYERGQDFMELENYVSSVKAIIGIGACRERVREFGMKMKIPTYIFEHLQDGFIKCVEVANSGDIVLLSPASASWDQYRQCEDRGDEFKKLVSSLKTTYDDKNKN